jgi:hypothetical protein
MRGWERKLNSEVPSWPDKTQAQLLTSFNQPVQFEKRAHASHDGSMHDAPNLMNRGSTLHKTTLLPLLVLTVGTMLPSFAGGDPPDHNSWRDELSVWRAQRAAGLQAPEGWLSLIGLGITR